MNQEPKVFDPKDDRVFGAEAINRRCDELRAQGKRPVLGTPGKGYRRACLPAPPPPKPQGSKERNRRLKQLGRQNKNSGSTP